MLAIINFPKINEKCMKILKYLHKTLVFERVNDKNHKPNKNRGSLKPCKAVFLFTKVWIDIDAR